MIVIQNTKDMQEFALAQRAQGKRLALVATMGNLHEGHRTLMRQARAQCEVLVVSIFVNPTQFGPNEDFEKYPRTPESDLQACEAEGVDVVFAPGVDQMYGDDRGVAVEVEGWGNVLCGASRPGHFRGVATVVLKLFNICQPSAAFFGWKDAQQFLILRRMVRALNVPVEMIGVETVRESDGLAMSSRNGYLSAEERRQAPELYKALTRGNEMVAAGTTDAAHIISAICSHIESNTQGKIDYVEAVSMDQLQPLQRIQLGNTLIALAVRFPSARLIDNIRV